MEPEYFQIINKITNATWLKKFFGVVEKIKKNPRECAEELEYEMRYKLNKKCILLDKLWLKTKKKIIS